MYFAGSRGDTPERWTRLLARQVEAYAHWGSMCVYDLVPFLHYPSIHAFFVGPVGAYSIADLFWLGSVLCVLGESRRSREATRQITRVDGDEIND